MRKPYVLLAALSIVLIAANVYMYTGNKKPAIPSAEKPGYIVRLVAENGATFCSGTVVGDNMIITAAHCIVEQSPWGMALRADDITIRADDNIDRKVSAKPLKASIQMDTAVLVGDFRQFKHANYISDVTKLAAIAKPGQMFKACGYPLGGHLYCNTLYYKEVYTFMWAAKGGILLPGMSGGPVFYFDMGGDTVVATNVAMDGDTVIISPTYNVDNKMPEK